MLTGTPPFNGSNDEEILKNVKEGKIEWNLPTLKYCSVESINLIKRMLEYNHEKRPNASEILQDDWITNYAPTASLDRDCAQKVLRSLKSFAANQKLMKAAISYIVNKLITQEELKDLRQVFLSLDKNNDGKLSYKEIIAGFTFVYGEASVVSAVDSIFNRLKKSKEEFITYEEFITWSIDKSSVISEEKLEAAFKLFDKNGIGYISASEIKEVLGRNSKRGDDYWNNIINEVDEVGKGQISLEQFKHLMNKVLDWDTKDLSQRFKSENLSFESKNLLKKTAEDL